MQEPQVKNLEILQIIVVANFLHVKNSYDCRGQNWNERFEEFLKSTKRHVGIVTSLNNTLPILSWEFWPIHDVNPTITITITMTGAPRENKS